MGWRITVAVEARPWHLIEDPEAFVRRWERALRAGRFLFVRYAGRRIYVNPRAIRWVEYVRDARYT